MSIRIDGDGMKTGLFLLQPPPGKVIGVHVRHRRVDFRFGFCRGIIHLGPYVELMEAFRPGMDQGMKTRWAVPCDFGFHPLGRLSFEFVPEVPWMAQPKPQEEAR